MYRRNYTLIDFINDNRGGFIIGIIIFMLLVSWIFTDLLPKQRAKAFFNELDQRPGFTKLVDLREYSQTKETLNIAGAFNQGFDNMMDKAMGYKLKGSYGSNDGIIESYNFVEILSPDGELIANGTYEGYWTSNMSYSSGCHIVCVDAPGKGLFDKEFKIESDKVIIRKK